MDHEKLARTRRELLSLTARREIHYSSTRIAEHCGMIRLTLMPCARLRINFINLQTVGEDLEKLTCTYQHSEMGRQARDCQSTLADRCRGLQTTRDTAITITYQPSETLQMRGPFHSSLTTRIGELRPSETWTNSQVCEMGTCVACTRMNELQCHSEPE